MPPKHAQAIQALQHRFPVWFQTQALIRGTGRWGFPDLPQIVSRTYNIEMPMYDTPPVVAKARAEGEISYSLAQTLADVVLSRMSMQRNDDVLHRITHYSGTIDLLVMTVEEFILAADMENEARAIELQQLREENRNLRAQLLQTRIRDIRFNDPER